MPIISSLLDNDLYKLTMGQAVLHEFPEIDVEYKFQCRTKGIDLRPYRTGIEAEIDHLCSLRFSSKELEYLKTLPFIKKDYLDFLRLLQLNREHVHIYEEDDSLQIRIAGPWFLTILFEVPVLAIVNEYYFSHITAQKEINYSGARDRLQEKINMAYEMSPAYKFADFGTRRRFSFRWHSELVSQLAQSNINQRNFVGTSNVLLAKLNGVRPIGTMAHEFIQAGQAVGVRLVDSQKFMLQKWVDEYRGDLGIALSDTVGLDAFLRDFDKYFSKLYDGVRQDSGDPYEACEKIIAHYERMQIDPRTKVVIFSDGLDFPHARELLDTFKDRINVSFGIGTNLTNDFPGIEPLQIVMKMIKCNGQPVAKISDTLEKGMCEDAEYLFYLKRVFSNGK
ncbi:MAG: nicotinate phosphoribosyltransferase [Promethearchaeota archaeon]